MGRGFQVNTMANTSLEKFTKEASEMFAITIEVDRLKGDMTRVRIDLDGTSSSPGLLGRMASAESKIQRGVMIAIMFPVIIGLITTAAAAAYVIGKIAAG
jgi:hypothetical protein